MVMEAGRYTVSGQQSAKARGRPRLRFHLAIVLVVKVVLLFLLWHAFIKPNKVAVDAEVMSERLAGAGSAANISTIPGENK